MPETRSKVVDDSLIRKRELIKSKLINFSKYLIAIRENVDEEVIIELETRLEKIDGLFNDFENIQGRIEDITTVIDHREREDFENNLYLQIKEAKSILQKFRYKTNQNYQSKQSSSNVKLPQINLPNFNGEYAEWLEFRDTFLALIHYNGNIGTIEKFHYLRASVSSSAAEVINSVDISEMNYQIAWELLAERYNNTSILTKTHLNGLIHLPILTKDSAKDLKNLIDIITKNLKALENLKHPVHSWDTIIIHIVSSKLDKITYREWESKQTTGNLPTLDEFKSFLKAKAALLETLELSKMDASNSKTTTGHNKQAVKFKSFNTTEHTPHICEMCKQAHRIFNCKNFIDLSPLERFKIIKTARLCVNCFGHNHSAKQCRLGPCKKCGKKHNTLLHFNNYSVEETHDTEQGVALTSTFSELVLLATAKVQIPNKNGQLVTCTALLDSGAQSNFITKKLLMQLGIPSKSVNITINGIAQISAHINKKCNLSIKSMHSSYERHTECFVVNKISDKLPCKIISKFQIPSNLQLADPEFHRATEIDLLIGAGLFWTLLCAEQQKVGNLLLQKTMLGWVVTGSVSNQLNERLSCNFSIQLKDEIEKFWKIEEIHNDTYETSQEEYECEKQFEETTTRTSEGRFIVRIPLKQPEFCLGNSFETAQKRLLHLERKFIGNDPFKIQYKQFMQEYENLCHMTKITNFRREQFRYFIPHHGVLREESLTTKLRVVFDASALTDSGQSLNEIQHKGPIIQNDIVDILLRFRQHSFVVIGDIAKMYRQILVHPEDRHLQCILWRNDSNEPISAYCLNTVTYGTTSAPYLAVKCIKTVAAEHKHINPRVARIIDSDFYVDDLITGFTNESEAIQTCLEIKQTLQKACFPLRKWMSNSPYILKHFQDKNDEVSVLSFGDNEQAKVLGMRWYPSSDFLTYSIDEPNQISPTKRGILSEVAKLYDPLGLVSPCIVVAKMIIQNLWSLHIDWDESIPQDIHKNWSSFRNNLTSLNQLKIKRQVIVEEPVVVQVHGFCDASKSAYGACVYVRGIDASNNIKVNLLCAKTRVAPLKAQTIPRLELCSALLLSKLMKTVKQSLTIEPEEFYWSDSQIVLCWIRTQSDLLQAFVGNRIKQIQSLTNRNNWNYVNTKTNPADYASRGVKPQVLVELSKWWTGPLWLNGPQEEWEMTYEPLLEIDLPEIRNKAITTLVVQNESFDIFKKFSSLSKLTRVTAYCLRFANNARANSKKQFGELTVEELENSTRHLVKIAQSQSFPNEVQHLDKHTDSAPKSKILKALAPFVDTFGIIRVGGRLKHSNLDFNAKHPMLISGKHPLAILIFQHFHKLLLHPGPQLLLSSTRQTFWVTTGMNLAKKVTKNCLTCFKFKPQQINPFMADLPEHRVTAMNPFNVTGVDYAGPFLIKERKGRCNRSIKAYVCLFICFVSKAMHLELVTDLSSETFMSALRRFTSRRGKPSYMYSDNGTNFVGVQKELRDVHEFLKESAAIIQNYCTSENITWKFIPPNTPHFGGLWESAVKSVKHHLLRSTKSTNLTYEEFFTILIQIEGIVNSRPLYPMSSDPNDMEPLTPAHFLIGKPLIALPDFDLSNIPINRLSRFQLIQRLKSNFWNQWSKQYLTSLQQRHKWPHQTGQNLQEGMMVLIKQENLPSCYWSLGRIINLHPGDDGIVRVVTIKTPRGTILRGVAKICPLPSPESEVSVNVKKGQFSVIEGESVDQEY